MSSKLARKQDHNDGHNDSSNGSISKGVELWYCQNAQCPKRPNAVFKTMKAVMMHYHHNAECAHAALQAALQAHSAAGMASFPGIPKERMIRRTQTSRINPHFTVGVPQYEDYNTFDDLAIHSWGDQNDDVTMTPQADVTVQDIALSPQQREEVRSQKGGALVFSNEHRHMIMLLRLVENLNAPDYAMEEILKWAQKAYIEGFDFQDCLQTKVSNVQMIYNKVEDAERLLPTYVDLHNMEGQQQHCRVTVFDFVSQLLSLLQDDKLMQWNNLAINPDAPLTKYTPPDGYLGEPNTAKWYSDTYDKMITNPRKQLFCPIIGYVDKTHIDSKSRFQLEPFTFTTSLFTEKTRRKAAAWRLFGYVNTGQGKQSSAQSRRQEKGVPCRNYHKQLDVLLKGLIDVQTNQDLRLQNATIRLGRDLVCVELVCPMMFIITDGQAADMLVGRYASHTRGVSRHCRACTVGFEDLDRVPDLNNQQEPPCCERIKYSRIHMLTKLGNDDAMQLYSQYKVDLAFNRVSFGGDSQGICGATPTEIMHALNQGLMQYVAQIFLSQLSDSYQNELDKLAGKFRVALNRQTARRHYPRLDMTFGVTNLAKLTASEQSGVLFSFCALAQVHTSWETLQEGLQANRTRDLNKRIKVLTKAVKKLEAEMKKKVNQTAENRTLLKHLNDAIVSYQKEHNEAFDPLLDILNLFEMLLCFEAWCKKPTFWRLPDEDGWGVYRSKYAISIMLNTVKQVLPRAEAPLVPSMPHLKVKDWPEPKGGNGWKVPKFHEMLHLVDDMVRFGAPRNYYAGAPEANHKSFAKRHGRRAQKRHAVFEPQCARRVIDTYVLDMAVDAIVDIAAADDEEDDTTSTTASVTSGGANVATMRMATSVRFWVKDPYRPVASRKKFGRKKNPESLAHLVVPDWSSTRSHVPDAVRFCNEAAVRFLLTADDTVGPNGIMPGATDVTICTQVKIDGLTFRCHPNYRNGGPWHDWVAVNYNEDGKVVTYPSKLLAVVPQEQLSGQRLDATYLLLHCTYERDADNSSCLFKRWKYNPKQVYMVKVEAVKLDTECMVIENAARNVGDPSKEVMQILSPDRWAGGFCDENASGTSQEWI